MHNRDQSLAHFCAELASSSPAPGGGGASLSGVIVMFPLFVLTTLT